MFRIIEEGLRNASGSADGIEVNGGTFSLQRRHSRNNAATRLATLFSGQADNRLRIPPKLQRGQPRFLTRASSGRSSSDRTVSMPLIWSPRSLAYISQPFSGDGPTSLQIFERGRDDWRMVAGGYAPAYPHKK